MGSLIDKMVSSIAGFLTVNVLSQAIAAGFAFSYVVASILPCNGEFFTEQYAVQAEAESQEDSISPPSGGAVASWRCFS